MSIAEILDQLTKIPPDQWRQHKAELARQKQQELQEVATRYDRQEQILAQLCGPEPVSKPKSGPLPLEDKRARVHPPLKTNEVVATAPKETSRPEKPLADQIYERIDLLGPRTAQQLMGDLGHRTSSKIQQALGDMRFIMLAGEQWQITSKMEGG